MLAAVAGGIVALAAVLTVSGLVSGEEPAATSRHPADEGQSKGCIEGPSFTAAVSEGAAPGTYQTRLVREYHDLYPVAQCQFGEDAADVRLHGRLG